MEAVSLTNLPLSIGTRFGWALVADKAMADEMNYYISNSVQNMPIESIARGYLIINSIVEAHGTPHDFFAWSAGKLSERWQRLTVLFAEHPSFKQTAAPGGIFVVVECPPMATQSCNEFFSNVGLKGLSCESLGLAPEDGRLCTRLVVGLPDSTFDFTMAKLEVAMGGYQA